MNPINYLANILGVSTSLLKNLDQEMGRRSNVSGVLERVASENETSIQRALSELQLSNPTGEGVKKALCDKIAENEALLLHALKTIPGKDEFEQAANLSKNITQVPRGFFLKKEKGQEILRKRIPENLLTFLGVIDIEEVLKKYDITEIFSALRFIETNEWMHETFDVAYGSFTPDDFEEREIEIKVLGPEWQKVAEAFVLKKHHNVSHLKEFGVIFLNPIKEDVSGKFVRDFALLLHYLHEVDFYSKLFRKYANSDDFSMHLKALLRGDVKEATSVLPGEWLIVQRYLIKENPNDPRLFLPRVNPESLHWLRGERDLASFKDLNFQFWNNLDWVGGILQSDHEEIISFDLEDNAMSLVSSREGKDQSFMYHQREAMWTKLFKEYVGGEENMEKLLIENFDKGIISF